MRYLRRIAPPDGLGPKNEPVASILGRLNPVLFWYRIYSVARLALCAWRVGQHLTEAASLGLGPSTV